MCVGIPARVLRVEGDEDAGKPVASVAAHVSGHADAGARIGELRAQCESRHGPCTIDLALTGPLAPGTWVLTFLGAAREVIDEARARDIDAALDALEAIARGETRLDAYFPGLSDREPELPAHLAHLVAPSAVSVTSAAPVSARPGMTTPPPSPGKTIS